MLFTLVYRAAVLPVSTSTSNAVSGLSPDALKQSAFNFLLGDLYALYSLGITDLDPNSGTGLPTNLSQMVYLFMPGR